MRLDIQDLSAGYGKAEILRSISLTVESGALLVLLGRNGAGKSTLLKSIIGLAPPRAGSIRADGTELAGLPPHRIARLGIGYVPEERRIFTDLTVAENIEVGRRQGADGHWTPARLFTLFPALAELSQRRGGQLSGGEQQMLALARTLAGNPRLLLLDEPAEGLAPVIVDQLGTALAALKATGTTILLTEQSIRFASGLADQAALIETGTVVWTGTLPALMQNDALRMRVLAV